MHSLFLLASLLKMVVKRLDRTFNAGIFFLLHLLVFSKSYAIGNFSKALPAKHQVVCADQSII
jgi:hypothetical protein